MFSAILFAFQLEVSFLAKGVLFRLFLTESPFKTHTLEEINHFSINRNPWFWWGSDVVRVTGT
ncbi:hypothetical protein OIU84_030124 [Salix udensis]|uniref:Uncharacterized protein n=1 Tax=Salix udensis TaxID=889485 RepID=A0AAD6P7R0_9ROSI|nr:hypothetical protein OIU84_030124 [Salix udensis]